MSNTPYDTFNIDEDDDDILIEPDVPSQSKPKAVPASKQDMGSTLGSDNNNMNSSSSTNQQSNDGGNAGGFFNFASFVTPQNLLGNNVQVKERQFTGGNTLDESVVTTLKRDLSKVGNKLILILWPLILKQKLVVVSKFSNRINVPNVFNRSNNNGMEIDEEDVIENSDINHLETEDYSKETIAKILDWDLWGPLVFVLGFSLAITYLETKSLNTSTSFKSSEVFSGSFTFIWVVLSALALNTQLVSPVPQATENGGVTSGVIALSFFQCISILSYTLFPIILGSVVSIFIHWKLIRAIICLILLLWSLLCFTLIMAIINNCEVKGSNLVNNLRSTVMEGDDDYDSAEGSNSDKRLFLIVYPVFLCYALLSWLLVIV